MEYIETDTEKQQTNFTSNLIFFLSYTVII
jgi:hypothetical protein